MNVSSEKQLIPYNPFPRQAAPSPLPSPGAVKVCHGPAAAHDKPDAVRAARQQPYRTYASRLVYDSRQRVNAQKMPRTGLLIDIYA